MQGGVGANKLNKMFNIPDMNQIKMKNTDLMDDFKIKMKTNNILNENKIVKNKNQSTDYLIKYFEGIIKNYINLYESRGENMNELKEIIFNNNYKNKFKGGVDAQDLIGYTNETDQNQHPNIQMPLNNNNNRGTIYIKFYKTPNHDHAIRILHAGNCFLCDQYNIINNIRSIRNILYNNGVDLNKINLMNNNLMNNNLMNIINCNGINNNINVDPTNINNFTNYINIIDNTINLNTDLGNIINFRYVLEEMSQQFNNFIQQIDDPQHNQQNNQIIPQNIIGVTNYRNFLQYTIEEIDYLLNPQNQLGQQNNFNQQINQLNPATHMFQINKFRNLQALFQNRQRAQNINNELQSIKEIDMFNPDFMNLYYIHINNIININNNINNELNTLNTTIHIANDHANIRNKYTTIHNLNQRANARQINNNLNILSQTNFQSFDENDKIIINKYRKINNILQEIININPLDHQIIQQINYQINLLNNQITIREYQIKVYKQYRPALINQQINQLTQQINQLYQQFYQLNIMTQLPQIHNIQNQIHNLRNRLQYLQNCLQYLQTQSNNNITILQEYENYIYANINQQIFQRRELIIQLNQLLNQCYLGFIKHTVQNFNQRFNTLGINPIINSHINISNIYDLEIDLRSDHIVDHCNKIYSDHIETNIDQSNITELLKKVIERLIDFDYNEYTNGIWLDNYVNNNIRPVPIIDIEKTRITIYKSITSLLIMILTIRNNMDKNIYKMYNSSYLLAATCKYMFLKNMSPDDYADVFGGNNVNLLTYIEYSMRGVIGFYGDCALNVLTCARNRDLRELFVHKIKYSEKPLLNPLHNPQQHNPQQHNPQQHNPDQLQIQYDIQIPNLYNIHNNIANFNQLQNHYIGLIDNELDNNNNNMLPVYNGCEFKTFIHDFVIEYRNFIRYIITNSREIHQYADGIRNNNTFNFNNLDDNNLMDFIHSNNNFSPNIQFNNIDFGNIYRWYKKFYSVLRNNLLDYRLTNNHFNLIVNLRNGIFNSLENLHGQVDLNNNNNKNKLILLMDNILITSGNSYIIFYINVLISLRLIRYKIDYIFDDDTMDILKHSNNKAIALKCFRNLGDNRNELEIIFPQCHEPIYHDNNPERYLFINTCLRDEAHAVLTIIKIDNINIKKIYLYDINDLTLYTSENFDINNIGQPIRNNNNNIVTYPFISYCLRNTIPIWPLDPNLPHRHWGREKYLKFRNLEYLKLFNNWQILMNVIPNNILNYTYNNNIINGKIFHIDTLLSLNFNEYTEDNFNREVYTIIKRNILNELINHCNNYINTALNNNQFNNQNLFNDITIIRNNLNIIAGDQNCSIRKLLFKFVKCLLKAKVHNNINDIIPDNEYINTANYFTDTYMINHNFIAYLNYNNNNNIPGFTIGNHFNFNINDDIQNILDIICYDIVAYNFNGGNYMFGKNISTKCNYSIIKRVLIILLIILIIIIIVLIVLYIINKYKNNDNFK